MKKIFLLIILIALQKTAFSQIEAWRVIIADSLTHKGIENATIRSGRVTLAADINGLAIIDRKIAKPVDSVQVSSIGYQPQTLALNRLKLIDTIQLLPSTITLKEVKINTSAPTVSVGDIKDPYRNAYMMPPQNEIAEFIPNNKKLTGTIISIIYRLKNKFEGIDKPFRVILYAKLTDSIFPGLALIKDTIIVRDLKKKNLFIVDVSKYGLRFPENGLFVALQTLPKAYYGDKYASDHDTRHLPAPTIEADGIYPEGDPVDMNLINTVKFGIERHYNPDKKDWNSWDIMHEGINWAIGASITPDE